MRIVLFARSKRTTRSSHHLLAALARGGHDVLWPRARMLRDLVGDGLADRSIGLRVRRHAPDVVLLYGTGFRLAPQWLAGLPRRPRVVGFVEGGFHKPFPSASLREIAPHLDVLFLTAGSFGARLRELGIARSHFITEGVDAADHHPVAGSRPEFRSDVAFVGQAWEDGDRVKLVTEIGRHFDLKVYGAGWERWGIRAQRENVGVRAFREICAGAKITVGTNNRNDLPLYFSNRTWHTLGCAGFHLTHHVPCLERIFENERHLVWFHGTDHCLRLIERYLEQPGERRRIAQEGHRLAHAHFSYDRVVERMLGGLERSVSPYEFARDLES